MTPKCEAHPLYPRPLECEGCVRVAEVIETQRKKDTDQVAVVASTQARERGAARKQAIQDCYACDTDGYINGVLCRHNEQARVAAINGAAYARQLLNERGVK